MQEVGGSIPPGSTKVSTQAGRDQIRETLTFFTASPSSRGLGHHPFTVDTGVRIPVGTPFDATTKVRFGGPSSFLAPASDAARA